LHAAVSGATNSWAKEANAVMPEVVGILLAAGADPNVVNEYDRSPLEAVVRQPEPKAVETARMLVAAGADIGPDRHGDTALRSALHGGIELVRVLLDAGADPSEVGAGRHWALNGASPLHVAAHSWVEIEKFRLLLDAASDIDVRNLDGVTPLHCAVAGRHTEKVRLLLAHGADTTAIADRPGALGEKVTAKTPLDIARELDDAALVSLLEGAQPTPPSE